MAIGRTFSEAYLKALRSMEASRLALEPMELPKEKEEREKVLHEALRVPRPDRPWYVAQAFREGMTVEQVHELSAIDPWFLRKIEELVQRAQALQEFGRLDQIPDDVLRETKSHGFSDRYLGQLLGYPESEVRAYRHSRGIRPVYKRVDTCAAEFEAYTPYLYSTYEEEDEAPPTDRKKVLILGSGPIRIGQGIEFDYCCVHAAFALREAGFETVMVNCNPETVSTDYDTSDRLYFEPLTIEDVLEVAEREKPIGAIVQFGGQTPLKLSVPLEKAGLAVLGTSPDAIDRAEDRERFAKLIEKLGLTQPENGVARSHEEAFRIAERIGYPVMVRPSYVLGGRAMETVYDASSLERYMREAVSASPEHPVLIDRFLKDAIEVDLDVVADRTGAVLVGGVLEHIQEAGVHSGDAAATMPPHSLSPDLVERMKDQAIDLARELKVIGLMNVQFAIQGKIIYILEVNPRASRTVPFISKASGVSLAKLAALCMVGKTLEELGHTQEVEFKHVAVKESVFPFARFAGVDVILGPEMKSTGEVMGIADDYPSAFAKSQLAAGVAPARHGLRAGGHRGHPLVPGHQGHPGPAGDEGEGGPAQHRRQDRRWGDHARDQHHVRQAGDLRQLLHPPRVPDARHPVLHDGAAGAHGGGRAGGAAALGPEREAAAGLPEAGAAPRVAPGAPAFTPAYCWAGVFSAKYSWVSALSKALVGSEIARLLAPLWP
jgi:carbamoyl-phosphate synthase large subunit